MALVKDERRFYCKKCGSLKKAKDFYKTNNTEKYPTGYLELCKECLTTRVDNYNPDTYLWILQECDVPYVPKAWSACLDRYAGERNKITKTNIIGGYLAKMKMIQYNKWRWKDSKYLQEKEIREVEEALKTAGADSQQIDIAIGKIKSYKIPTEMIEVPDLLEKAQELEREETKPVKEPLAQDVFNKFLEQYDQTPPPPSPSVDVAAPAPVPYEPAIESYIPSSVPQEEEETDSFDLTPEDIAAMKIKWGKSYKPYEWVRLEQFYNEMLDSYDIQSAGHEDILKMVCKTSLKANQLLDLGDVDGAQKMVKMYDSLMKSGNFTAAQNKNESGEAVDSISEFVEMCEKEGYIERYYVDSPKDKVDLTIKDMQRYTSSLIGGETNLTNLIEAALKQNIQEDKEAEENTETEIVDFETESDEDVIKEIESQKNTTDDDFKEFYEFEEEEEERDLEIQLGKRRR